MEAQAIEVRELTSPERPGAFAVRWRWSLLLFVALVVAVGLNAAILANEVRTEALANFTPSPICPRCLPRYAELIELIWVAGSAIVLATIAAIPAMTVIGLLGRRVGVRPSAISATALLAGLLVFSVAARLVTWTVRSLADEPGATLAGAVVAPAIEETAKASAVLVIGLAMGWRLGMRPGIVLGAAAGLLVTILEIALYAQLSSAGGTNSAYGTIIAIRLGLFGLGVHVVSSAIAGAGVGAWLAQDRPRRARVLIGCLAAAIAVHGVWNLVGSTLMTTIVQAIYPNPDFTESEPFPLAVLFVASSLTQLLVLAIPIAALAFAWRRDAARAAPPAPTMVEALPS